MVPRIIHSCVSHPYESVGRFIAKRMRDYLNTLRHLYHTTDSMLADMSQTYPATAKISKVDIKDFYMEGYASDLVIEAFEYETNMEVASAMKKLLFEYLRQQVVQAPGGQNYEVRQGAGMGATASAEVADMKYFNLSERDFACSQTIKNKYQIHFYGRYREDICIINSGP